MVSGKEPGRGDGMSMISARYYSRTEGWIEIKGLGTGIYGISIGEAYSLRDAVNAAINEWESEYKEMREKREASP